MNRALQAAWCRLPVCLFAVGKELGKSHLSWSTGKYWLELSLCSIITGNHSSSSSHGTWAELMTLLPPHPSPRMRLNVMGSLWLPLRANMRAGPFQISAALCIGMSLRQVWSSSSSVCASRGTWAGFVWCLHSSAGSGLMCKHCCEPLSPFSDAALPLGTEAIAKLGLNKLLFL